MKLNQTAIKALDRIGQALLKFNPNHGPDGRFSSGRGGGAHMAPDTGGGTGGGGGGSSGGGAKKGPNVDKLNGGKLIDGDPLRGRFVESRTWRGKNGTEVSIERYGIRDYMTSSLYRAGKYPDGSSMLKTRSKIFRAGSKAGEKQALAAAVKWLNAEIIADTKKEFG